MSISSYLREVVMQLARSIGRRTWEDHDRLERTVQYISGQLASFGYSVGTRPFTFRGNTYHNIIAELPGTSSPERALIIGAHYDTVSTTPGADDNASGIAGLLALAREFAGKPQGITLRFVAFALEEPPVYRGTNMGSYHYARSLREKGEQVEGMICLEMIGYFCDQPGCQRYPFPFMNRKFPKAGNYIALVGNRRSKAFTESFASGFRGGVDLPALTLNAPAIVIGIDFSDHWSFYRFGYRALMVTDTAFYRNPHYHAPTDLPETLDFDRMAKVVEGLKAALGELGK